MTETPDFEEIELCFDNQVENRKFDDLGDDPFARPIKNLKGVNPALKRKASRKLSKVMEGVDGAASQQINPPNAVGTAYSEFDVALPPYNLDYLAQIYEVNPANFAAINVKVANIVGLGFDWLPSPKTQEALDKVDDSDKLVKIRRKLTHAKNELNDWIETLNKEDTFLETLIKVYTDLEATGNGYLEIGRTDTGTIGYIGHIPSVSIRVRIKRDGFMQLIADRAVFFRNYGDETTPDPIYGDPRPNELIHLKKYTPTDSFYGVSDAIAARNALAGSEYASRYNLDYFEHKAVPRYIITLQGGTLSPESQQRLVNFFRGNVKGKNHRTVFIPLPTGTKEAPVKFEMNAVEAGKQDSSFDSYDDKNDQKILMAHRVPKNKVSLSDGAALAAANDADKTFKETVCRPAQDIFEKKVGQIFKEVTNAFVFKLNELTLTDEINQAKIDQIYLTTGTIVPNEVRERMGRPGIKGGDTIIAAAKAKPTGSGTGGLPNPAQARNQARAVNAPDTTGQSRNAKGEGRQQA